MNQVEVLYRLCTFLFGCENNKIFQEDYATIVKLMQIKGKFNLFLIVF